MDLQNFHSLAQVGIEDLQLLAPGGSTLQAAEPPLRLGTDPVYASHALLHRRWHPRDSVVVDAGAERVEILALLEQVGADEHKGVAGHPELPYEPLVDLAGHAANRLLRAQQDAQILAHLAALPVPRVGDVGIADELEVGRDFGQLVIGRPVARTSRNRTLPCQEIKVLINAGALGFRVVVVGALSGLGFHAA